MIKTRALKPRQTTYASLKHRFSIGGLTLTDLIKEISKRERLFTVIKTQLLTRTFDRNYLVKYLGIDAFTVYDGIRGNK